MTKPFFFTSPPPSLLGHSTFVCAFFQSGKGVNFDILIINFAIPKGLSAPVSLFLLFSSSYIFENSAFWMKDECCFLRHVEKSGGLLQYHYSRRTRGPRSIQV
jgi:hypothetical protein